jgi:hypothetical protein
VRIRIAIADGKRNVSGATRTDGVLAPRGREELE